LLAKFPFHFSSSLAHCYSFPFSTFNLFHSLLDQAKRPKTIQKSLQETSSFKASNNASSQSKSQEKKT
jgi:hypothetical protein